MKPQKVLLKVISATLAVICTAFLTSCFFFPEEEPVLDPPVVKAEEAAYITYEAKRTDISRLLTVTGNVDSRTGADCFFTDYTGTIKAIYPRPGDRVEAGQLIAELDVGELEYELETARITAELAALDAASGSPQAQLDLELAQNNYKQLEDRMNGSRIFAPMAGLVSFTEILTPGEEINPQRVLVRIVDPEALCVTADESDNPGLEIGDEVKISVSGENYDGVISETDGVLRVDFTEGVPDISRLGALADIVFIKESRENVIVIPKNLVKTLGERTYVQVYDEEQGVKRDADVVTGISNAVEVEIVSGLEEGQQVVVR